MRETGQSDAVMTGREIKTIRKLTLFLFCFLWTLAIQALFSCDHRILILSFQHHKIWFDFSWSQNKYFIMSTWPRLPSGIFPSFFSFFFIFCSHCQKIIVNSLVIIHHNGGSCPGVDYYFFLGVALNKWLTNSFILQLDLRDCCLAEWAFVWSLKWEEYFVYGVQSQNWNTNRWVFPNYLEWNYKQIVSCNTTHVLLQIKTDL